jgi:hypothetical protein
VFLLAAGRRLRELGVAPAAVSAQVSGVDLHEESLQEAEALLAADELGATLRAADFFEIPTPSQLGDSVGWQDAVVGNPPFIRYHEHRGEARAKAAQAALAQKVRVSGLASSWAATLVHASAFLKPEGCLAMVLPAELLTVHYAEPVRRWLRTRFAAVSLFMFERLQFAHAEEQVVLLVARGSGGCDAFNVFPVEGAEALSRTRPGHGFGVTPAAEGKWSDLVLEGSFGRSPWNAWRGSTHMARQNSGQ